MSSRKDLETVRRVVASFQREASYFSVGTIVLYGKYKNHRGIVRSFGKDQWGNPTVEIEPIPKGRKQNKVFGLFRIWKAEVKEKALAELAKQETAQEGGGGSVTSQAVLDRYLGLPDEDED